MNRTGYTTVREALTSGGAQASRRFRVKSVAGDWLVCRTWNGEKEGDTDVLVAKSFLLRRSRWDGVLHNGVTYTYTSDVERTATNGTATETQVVVPAYVVGDEVWATRNCLGGTGVWTPEEEQLVWLDDNRDGRAWAKKAS